MKIWLLNCSLDRTQLISLHGHSLQHWCLFEIIVKMLKLSNVKFVDLSKLKIISTDLFQITSWCNYLLFSFRCVTYKSGIMMYPNSHFLTSHNQHIQTFLKHIKLSKFQIGCERANSNGKLDLMTTKFVTHSLGGWNLFFSCRRDNDVDLYIQIKTFHDCTTVQFSNFNLDSPSAWVTRFKARHSVVVDSEPQIYTLRTTTF